MNEMAIDLPAEFIGLCTRDGVRPEKVIRQFIADVCGLPYSSGSDERILAQRYYERCGYTHIGVVPERLQKVADGLVEWSGVTPFRVGQTPPMILLNTLNSIDDLKDGFACLSTDFLGTSENVDIRNPVIHLVYGGHRYRSYRTQASEVIQVHAGLKEDRGDLWKFYLSLRSKILMVEERLNLVTAALQKA
jgi:hypothetical protein